MWLMTRFGFFSIVQRSPKEITPTDERRLQVRARRAVDLERLRDTYLPELSPTERKRFRDYEFRGYCTHEQFAVASQRIVADIDYTNFKDSVRDRQLHDGYMNVWSAMFNALSSKHHSDDYFGLSRRQTRRVTREIVTSELTDDWGTMDDMPVLRDLLRSNPLPPLNDEQSGVALRPDGNIDHSQCDHSNSVNARRRCRRRVELLRRQNANK